MCALRCVGPATDLGLCITCDRRLVDLVSISIAAYDARSVSHWGNVYVPMGDIGTVRAGPWVMQAPFGNVTFFTAHT